VIASEEGIKGLTRGMLPKFLYIIPAAAVSFVCYEEISRAFHLGDQKSGVNRGESASGGWQMWGLALPVLGMAGARIIGSLCRTPFDILKQRMQIQGSLSKLQYKNSKQALMSIWKTEGLKSLFSYAHVSIMRDLPFSAVYFCLYDFLKTTQTKYKASRGETLTPINNMISGGVAGLTATTVTIPLDVIKTKLQTQASLPPADRVYSGVIQTFLGILRTEGVKGLTRGLTARALYLTPAGAIVFASYEQYKHILSKVW